MRSGNKIIKLTFEEAKNIIDTRPEVTVADVREEQEFVTGHVEEAINLPLTELIDVSPEEGKSFAEAMVSDKSLPIMVYCRTGRRSAMAAEALAEFGYEKIYDMGGLAGWPYEISYD